MNKASASFLSVTSGQYGEQQVEIQAVGRTIYVISDLHLAAGLNPNYNYDGTENFFADASFARFINHLQNTEKNQRAILIINGDFVDFLRIRTIPQTDEDFAVWQSVLKIVGIYKTGEALRTSIVKKERDYGLKTNDYKSIWKLHSCIQGHRELFERLGLWLLQGNSLVIIKGNHDLEWYWKPVRDYLQWYFAEYLSTRLQKPVENLLNEIVLPQTLFVDHTLLIDKKIYIEHGHRFQNVTEVKGDPVLSNGTELNLPFGSFFNRYLINRLELAYPYLDNVRPSQNILPILIRERFPLAVKVLFHYIPFMVLIIPKKLYWQTFKYLLSFLWVIVLPIIITILAIVPVIKGIHFNKQPSFIMQQLLAVLKGFGFLFLSYIFGRILSMVRLKDSPSLYENAIPVLALPDVEMVTFGHTHNPEQITTNQKHYVNTGTWIPVFESSSSDVRFDKTYTFLRIKPDENGGFAVDPLLRWNDDASREEYLILNDKK